MNEHGRERKGEKGEKEEKDERDERDEREERDPLILLYHSCHFLFHFRGVDCAQQITLLSVSK